MTAPRHEPVDDLSIVPGLADVPAPRAEDATAPLDPALDPDRYDPARDSALAEPPAGPLDPALDPDRYDPARDDAAGTDLTLPGLLGAGAFEDERNAYEWAYGLLVVVAFLALVSWFFGSVASP